MKYVVTKPISYAQLTGVRTRKGTRERKLVRHEIGDVVDFDDALADKFYPRLQPYFEPPKPRRKPKPVEAEIQTTTEPADFGGDGDAGS